MKSAGSGQSLCHSPIARDIWSCQKSATSIPRGYRKVRCVMWIVYVVLILGVVLGISIMVIDNIKKRKIQQKQNAIDEWNRRVNALREVTEQAAKEDLALAGETLRLYGMWFDIAARELYVPDVFWGLGPRSTTKALVTIFKACVGDHMINHEAEGSRSKQDVTKACTEGIMKALISRATIDPKEALEVMNLLASPGQSAEDSIHNLLLSPKLAPKS